jgi:hypothetical protein
VLGGLAKDLGEELGFGGEVAIDGAGGDVGLRGDRGDLRLGVAAAGDQPPGRGDDALADRRLACLGSLRRPPAWI